MDFKWKLSRPGIELEFETGSIGEAIGLLEQEGTQITEVFGFTMGNVHGSTAIASGTVAPAAAESEVKTRKPRAGKVEATAPAPLPVPTSLEIGTITQLPPNALPPAPAADALVSVGPNLTIPADGSVPPFLARPAPPPLVAAPPLAPLPPAPPAPPSPPPVGVLGPKVVEALNLHKAGNTAVDPTGQLLSDWLSDPKIGLTIKGASYDEACRSVLMTSDEKLKGVALAFGIK